VFESPSGPRPVVASRSCSVTLCATATMGLPRPRQRQSQPKPRLVETACKQGNQFVGAVELPANRFGNVVALLDVIDIKKMASRLSPVVPPQYVPRSTCLSRRGTRRLDRAGACALSKRIDVRFSLIVNGRISHLLAHAARCLSRCEHDGAGPAMSQLCGSRTGLMMRSRPPSTTRGQPLRLDRDLGNANRRRIAHSTGRG
jgi:hypothetical protein